MRIFARYSLVPDDESPDDELLLEGSWPRTEDRPGRWSLDDSIDARFTWIDPLAIDLAERAGVTSGGLNFAYINALALRYHLVKLLRVIAFFHHVRPVRQCAGLTFHAAEGDEDYVVLLRQLGAAHGVELIVDWRGAPSAAPELAPRPPLWRQWAATAARPRLPPATGVGSGQPRVVVCGNPHILNPVCAELVSRRVRVGWLYERFAARSWLRWRAAGVEQLVCETGRRPKTSFSDVASHQRLTAEGIDLTPVVDRWLARRGLEEAHHQSLLIERVEAHFRHIRPTAIVVDEDATPLKRIAIALGRSHGASSVVVQHGAPCGRFGFLPLAADKIAVWGDSAGRQLRDWGLPAERIHTAGWPKAALKPLKRSALNSSSKRFLLLATMPPRDERPDNVEFHLTTANYWAMLDMVCQVLSKIDGATLTIKPHPRDAGGAVSPGRIGAGDDRVLHVKIDRKTDLLKLVARSDCVLSCASTAGIEAALAGAPVVQLLPTGSGNILPAADWGFIGSARIAEELDPLVDQALARGWRQDSPARTKTVAAHGRAAAARVADSIEMLSNGLEIDSGDQAVRGRR